jgi:hypothetical protein
LSANASALSWSTKRKITLYDDPGAGSAAPTTPLGRDPSFAATVPSLVSAFVSGGASVVVRGPRGSIDGATMRISTTLGTSAATKRQKSPTLSDEGTAKTHTVGCRPRGSASASSPTFPVGPEDDAESVSVSRNK